MKNSTNSLTNIESKPYKEIENKTTPINLLNIENECFDCTNHFPDPDPDRENNKLLIGFCSFILVLLAFNIWSHTKPTQAEVQNALENSVTNVFIAFVEAVR